MNTEAKLIDLLHDFDNAMLVTRGEQGQLAARPMAIAQVQEQGTLWFVTDRHSGKVDDMQANHHVAVVMQSDRKFVSISGSATMVDDRQKLNDLWKESWKVWFPEGKSSDSIVLLKIEPNSGDYWDNSGASGIRYLLKAGKAYLQGERPEADQKTHASVSMSGGR